MTCLSMDNISNAESVDELNKLARENQHNWEMAKREYDNKWDLFCNYSKMIKAKRKMLEALND